MATTASLPAYMLPGVAVHQPPHLEGDASLATEILPGPPSSLQQSALKRDPRKPSMAYSYLPPSDPGSTYSGLTHGTLIGQDLEGPRSKRSRVDKGPATGRAQRASARNQGSNTTPASDPSIQMDIGTSSISLPIILDPDSVTVPMDEEPSISRSNSSTNLQDPSQPNMSGKPKKKDKGKGKETDTPPLRVKEEPKSFSLLTPEPPSNLLNNEDHCSACRSYGSLVYCDGCPRAFHFWCLDPPMENVDDDGDARWFCSTCVARKHPPQKPSPSLLSALIHQLQISNPVEFQLPEEIRTFFKDVASGPKGNYVDGSEIRPPRINRHGQLEERDPYRLRDRNGVPVLCFQCGMSALPDTLTASAPAAKRPRRSTSKAASPEAWKSMLSCDYCNLHWHMDCVDPPLMTLPSFNKKWMCPNHAERILAPKRRIPKGTTPIDITRSRQYNNGNIDVIHPEYSATMFKPSVAVDEVLINGRRYRVPERVIVLDFWNKLNKWDEHILKDADIVSGISSPLTSLSSLDDSDDHIVSQPSVQLDELSAAQVLCDMSLSMARRFEHSHNCGNGDPGKILVEHGVQTDREPPKPPVTKNKVGRPRKHPLPSEPGTNGVGKHLQNRSTETTKPPSGVKISTLTLKQRRTSQQQILPETSTRELRSRSRNHNNDTPLTSVSSRSSVKQTDDMNKDNVLPSISIPTTNNQSKPKVNVKMEDIDSPSLMSTSFSEHSVASTSGLSKTPRSNRTPRQPKQKDVNGSVPDTKPKRGRKRKVRDDELPSADGENGLDSIDLWGSSKAGKEEKNNNGNKPQKDSKKLNRTPVRHGQLHAANQDATPTSSSVPVVLSPSLSITPSLKIRLPRLSSLNMSNTPVTSTHLDTPTLR